MTAGKNSRIFQGDKFYIFKDFSGANHEQGIYFYFLCTACLSIARNPQALVLEIPSIHHLSPG